MGVLIYYILRNVILIIPVNWHFYKSTWILRTISTLLIEIYLIIKINKDMLLWFIELYEIEVLLRINLENYKNVLNKDVLWESCDFALDI